MTRRAQFPPTYGVDARMTPAVGPLLDRDPPAHRGLVQDFVGVQGVIPKQRLAELSRRSNLRGFLQLGSHVGAIALCSVALHQTWGTWWAIPVFAVQGILINFLFACQHECNHATAFRTRAINTWVARVCGFLLFYPCDYEKLLHFTHHRYTQNDAKDPELILRPAFTSAGQYLWLLSGLPHFFGRWRSLIRQASGVADDWYLTARQRVRVVRAARWHLFGYAVVAFSAVLFNSAWPLIYWVGPIFCTKWAYWVQGLQEHLVLTHAPNTLHNTRTSKTNFLMRWLNWNMTYHTVHHTFPAVPFHAMPELHREVVASVSFELPTNGYWEFHWGMVRSLLGGQTERVLVAAAYVEFAARAN